MRLIKIITGLAVLFYSCSHRPTEKSEIKIIGSDTMFELTSNLAEQYMKDNPGISVIVLGGGTATGIRALIGNETDICAASRNLKPDEAKLLGDYYGSLALIFLIAKDGLSVYLHPDNPIKDMSLQNVKDIYTGKIKNWKEIGGNDASIIPVTRNPNSGTYLYFKEHVLEGDEYISGLVVIPTTKEIVRYVEENVNAIGYGGIGYSGNIIHSKINGIEPSESNVRNDTYPISRYLHFFTTKAPEGAVKNFIDWVLSPVGQAVVRKSGSIALWENKL